MKDLIEKYLTDLGYSEIRWYWGRRGYFLLAVSPYRCGSACFNVAELVEEILRIQDKIPKIDIRS